MASRQHDILFDITDYCCVYVMINYRLTNYVETHNEHFWVVNLIRLP